MQDEQPLSEQESLDLIARMINKAKCDYEDTAISALMWGGVITVCSIVAFIGVKLNMPALDNIWYLTIAAVFVQVIISVREKRRKRFSGYTDSAVGGIWISFGIGIFLLSYYANKFHVPAANSVFLILYGIPTFATGFATRFTPMTIGGLACWVMAIAAMYTTWPYDILYGAAGAQLAWFIPGLILRRKYQKAKKGNV